MMMSATAYSFGKVRDIGKLADLRGVAEVCRKLGQLARGRRIATRCGALGGILQICGDLLRHRGELAWVRLLQLL